MAHTPIRDFLTTLIADEIAPHVKAVPGISPLQYLNQVVDRFSNTEIEDTTRRVAFDGSSRQPGFLIPSIIDGLKKGMSVDGLALVSAMWCKYCEGIRDDGSKIEPNDPHWEALNKTALLARDDASIWLCQHQYYGELNQNPQFSRAFFNWHQLLHQKGVQFAIESYLGSQPVVQNAIK